MLVAEYVADFIANVIDYGKISRVYGVCGAGAMHLNDAICNHPGIKFVAMHHEQAASFAAEADARVSNQIGILHVTAGPGVTNTITGIACAWADSIPMMVIAGQVERRTLKGTSGLRQLGVSEVDGVAITQPITKYSAIVRQPGMIRYHLELAAYTAKSGRPGPVYLEIPLDVQAAEIDPIGLMPFIVPQPMYKKQPDDQIRNALAELVAAERPVIIVGNGARLAGANAEKLLQFEVPILTSWNASDMFDSTHPCVIGRPGLIGDRAGNFAVQNADLVIAIGTRLSIPQTGHHPEGFAPDAKLIVVDIDGEEAGRQFLGADDVIVCDAKYFIDVFVSLASTNRWRDHSDWLDRCQDWKAKYPVITDEHRYSADGVNSYYFIEELASRIDRDAIIVTDVGTAFVGTMQAMPMTGRHRLFHSSGIAPMGYGLPAAIGAAFANPDRQIICICGDGGIMFNLQELQTIVHHKLPIKIFVLCNGGYMTMQHTQDNHFGRESVSSPKSGVSFPNFSDISEAFGIPNLRCFNHSKLVDILELALGNGGCGMHPIYMPLRQQLAPRVQSRIEDGKFVKTDIADLWPHLPRDEYEENMNQKKGISNVVKRFDESRQEILAAE